MKNYIIYIFKIFFFFLTIFSISCNKEIYEHDHFFIKNNGATMSVIVKGNQKSSTFIVFLHGGPGGNAITASYLPAFKELEANHNIVYWDQRASGLSQGNPATSTFTLDQFKADLDLLIKTINVRYNNPSIYIFGHSWGGALGTAYLAEFKDYNNIKGFINMDSGHNLEMGLPSSVLWVKNYAQKMINENNDTEYWKQVFNWCNATPDMKIPENYFKYVEYLKKTNAYTKDLNKNYDRGNVKLIDILNSYFSLSIFFNGPYLYENFNILELNLSTEVSKINTPTLVLWGKHDGVNLLEFGQAFYDSLTVNNKNMVILENSAHEGYIEEKELFVQNIENFILQNK